MSSTWIGIGLLAFAAVSDQAPGGEAPFDMAIRTREAGVSLVAVSGCDWNQLSFSSGEQPHRAIVTSRGVRTISPDFELSRYEVPDGVRFAFLVVADADGFTTEAIRGCRWTSLTYRESGAASATARLTQIQVNGSRDD